MATHPPSSMSQDEICTRWPPPRSSLPQVEICTRWRGSIHLTLPSSLTASLYRIQSLPKRESKLSNECDMNLVPCNFSAPYTLTHSSHKSSKTAKKAFDLNNKWKNAKKRLLREQPFVGYCIHDKEVQLKIYS